MPIPALGPGARVRPEESKRRGLPKSDAKPGAGDSKSSGVTRPETGPGRLAVRAVESKAAKTGQSAAAMEDAFKPGALERLAVACDELMVTVAQMRSEDADEPIHLVLGAPATEWERFAPGRWIFLHHQQQPHQPYPGLCADFNNLEHLGMVAEALTGEVDHIYFDHDAMKSLVWNTRHLGQVRSMLVPGTGTFHFALDQCGSGLPVRQSYQPETRPTPAGILASSSLAAPEDGLPIDFLLPHNFPEFGKAMRLQAIELCRENLLHPAIYDTLGRSFDQVVPERNVPEFLRRHPKRPNVQEDYLACRVEDKRR